MKRTLAGLGLILMFAGNAEAEGMAPKPVFETVAPVMPVNMSHPAVLIFSKANGWQHDSRTAAAAAVAKLSTAHGWRYYETENAAIFNPRDLRRFDTIVLNSTTGDLFTSSQQNAFRRWVERGGRVVALHGAGGTPGLKWAWYSNELIGAEFVGHPAIQTATLRAEDTDSPLMHDVPANWSWSDEWYAFDRNPRGPRTHVLASVDETTYQPGQTSMKGDHPIIWTRCTGRGGVFFSAIGHKSESWSDQIHLALIDNALVWAVEKHGKVC